LILFVGYFQMRSISNFKVMIVRYSIRTSNIHILVNGLATQIRIDY